MGIMDITSSREVIAVFLLIWSVIQPTRYTIQVQVFVAGLTKPKPEPLPKCLKSVASR